MFFKKPDSGLFIKYNTKNKKSSKKLLTDSFYSGILTKLSQGIVSSEQTIWKVLKKAKKVVDKEMKMW